MRTGDRRRLNLSVPSENFLIRYTCVRSFIFSCFRRPLSIVVCWTASQTTLSIDVYMTDHKGVWHWDGFAMRRRVVAAWLTAVVALSAAVRHADDAMSSPSTSGGNKHDRHVAMGDHVTSTQRYINRKLEQLETRLGRRLAEQAKRLNHSISIHYLEKVTLTELKLKLKCLDGN